MKDRAHKFLIDNGCTSMAQQYSAYAVEKMLVEFTNQMLNFSKSKSEHKIEPPFYFLDGELLVRLIKQDGNRLNQEEFKCVECGYANNADTNAAINIEKRVSSTVLRTNLLKQNKLGNGTYEPKVLKRNKVKEVLLSFRYNPPMVDMDIIKVISFDYV